MASRSSVPSLPSTSSLTHTTSVRSNRLPPPINTVITSPPWAKDEPPSPKELTSTHDINNGTESRPSDVASFQSTYGSNMGSQSRWWAFTLPRPRQQPPDITQLTSPLSGKSDRKNVSFKDRSMSWLPHSSLSRESTSFARRGKDPNASGSRNWNLSIPLPTPAAAPFTLSHTATPGWEAPWTARTAAQGPRGRQSPATDEEQEESTHDLNKDDTARKRKLRAFILNNVYVPLLFRFINISFTTAALGLAIRIREQEKRYHVMGAVGSSPTIVIIFAPLTLVHVMSAIYLEYFGRPLGLWRTSAKLAHTLLEVLFICAWSAALSLCFDNFFTSVIPCASASSTAWYSQIARGPALNLPIADIICDEQLALICLVGVGLSVYCTNLVISLFRIFEKVKYHPAASMRSSWHHP